MIGCVGLRSVMSKVEKMSLPPSVHTIARVILKRFRYIISLAGGKCETMFEDVQNRLTRSSDMGQNVSNKSISIQSIKFNLLTVKMITENNYKIVSLS